MTPEKRSGSLITVSSPARDLVDDFPSSYRSLRAKSRSRPAAPSRGGACRPPRVPSAPARAPSTPLERLAAVRHLARRRRRAGQAGKDVAGDQLDLLGLVAIGDEDEAIHPGLHVGPKLPGA